MAKKKITNNEIVEILQKEIRNVRGEIKSTKKELVEKIETESSFVAGVAKRGFDEAENNNKIAHKQLKSKIKDVKLIAQGIDRKLDAEVERRDDQDLRIKNHEERIVVLEKIA